jgi:hypothetical protein
MKILVSILCGLLTSVTILTAQAQPVTTLSNAELFSRQYAQVDTAKVNIENIQATREFLLCRKKKFNNICMVKTTISGTAWGALGLLVGSGIASIPFSSGTGGGSNSGLPSLIGIIIGGTPGAIVGISAGTYFSGRKYRKGNYMASLAGTILPALTVAGVTALMSDKNKYNMNASLITFAFAPITSTAAYYIFSEELPDTVNNN